MTTNNEREAELQARVKELEEAIENLRKVKGRHNSEIACNKLFDVCANKSPSSALDRAIMQAKVEALEDVAGEIEKTVWKTISIRSVCLKIRRMADELRKEN